MLYSLAGSNAFLLRLSQNPHVNADNSSTPSGTPTAAPTVVVEAPVVEHPAGFETDDEDVDAEAIDEVGTEVTELELDALEETTRFPVIFISFGPPTSKLKRRLEFEQSAFKSHTHCRDPVDASHGLRNMKSC